MAFPGFAQPLADCLIQLYRETCEILAQCETIPDISFDLARIPKGAGNGYADDLLDSAFAVSKIASLRSIKQANPCFLDSVKEVFEAGTAACHDSAFSLSTRQLASSLLVGDPTFLQDDNQGKDYSGICKLQSVFLAPRKVARTTVVEALLRINNVHNTIYQSGKSTEARASLNAVPKSEALTMSSTEFRTAFRNRLLIPHPQLLAHATCACGQDVDILGVHTQKCRLDGNLTNSTHNRLVACLVEMIRSCGQSVRVEVIGIFNNVDQTSNQRMDLVVFDSGRPTNQLYDVASYCGGFTF